MNKKPLCKFYYYIPGSPDEKYLSGTLLEDHSNHVLIGTPSGLINLSRKYLLYYIMCDVKVTSATDGGDQSKTPPVKQKKQPTIEVEVSFVSEQEENTLDVHDTFNCLINKDFDVEEISTQDLYNKLMANNQFAKKIKMAKGLQDIQHFIDDAGRLKLDIYIGDAGLAPPMEDVFSVVSKAMQDKVSENIKNSKVTL